MLKFVLTISATLLCFQICNCEQTCKKSGIQCSSDCKSIIFCSEPGSMYENITGCQDKYCQKSYNVQCAGQYCQGNSENTKPECPNNIPSSNIPDLYDCGRYHTCQQPSKQPISTCSCNVDEVYDVEKQLCVSKNSTNCNHAYCYQPGYCGKLDGGFYFVCFLDDYIIYPKLYYCNGQVDLQTCACVTPDSQKASCTSLQ